MKAFDPSCHGLVPIRVESFGPWIFVNLDAEAEPLVRMLGEIVTETAASDLSAFRPIARRDYEHAKVVRKRLVALEVERDAKRFAAANTSRSLVTDER